MQSKKLNFLIGTCLLVFFTSCGLRQCLEQCDGRDAKRLVLESYKDYRDAKEGHEANWLENMFSRIAWWDKKRLEITGIRTTDIKPDMALLRTPAITCYCDATIIFSEGRKEISRETIEYWVKTSDDCDVYTTMLAEDTELRNFSKARRFWRGLRCLF
ncbi:MAG: hypothetical protein OXH57_12505 [Ekhidna sp.]|nr:hypothetical protein [Ekhidna sp.]